MCVDSIRRYRYKTPTNTTEPADEPDWRHDPQFITLPSIEDNVLEVRREVTIHLSLSMCFVGEKAREDSTAPPPPFSLNPPHPVHTPTQKQVLVINKMSWKDQPLGKVRLPLKGLTLPIDNAVPLEVGPFFWTFVYVYTGVGLVERGRQSYAPTSLFLPTHVLINTQLRTPTGRGARCRASWRSTWP